MPRWDIDVEFHSQGESGNAYFITGQVRYVLKQLDKVADTTTLQQFDRKFDITKCKSYEEILDKLNEWVHLVDLDGEYDYL